MQHLNQKALAERWCMSPRTLERWRSTGRGPKFIKLNGRCIYSLEEVEAFEAARLRDRTPGKKRGSGPHS